MTAAAIPTTRSTIRPVWLVATLATLVGAIVTELFAQAAKAILDVPLVLGPMGGDKVEEVFVGGFATTVLMWSVPGIILAAVLARKATNPARTWTMTTVALTAVSLVLPWMAAEGTTTATKVLLCVTHVVAAAVIIPTVARRLAD